jgi:hypothetical protein
LIEDLRISRVLSLSSVEDRQELRYAARENLELTSLIAAHLDNYLLLFPDPRWHTVYSGGLVGVSGDLIRMLRLTKTLTQLRGCKGFEVLLAGFNNPTQVQAAYFETVVAGWCATRAISRSIEFSPEVTIKGRAKYPDFLWDTELGDIYCECKRSDVFDSQMADLIERLRSILDRLYDESQPWDSTLSLDVRFDGGSTNRIEHSLRSVVEQAAAALKSGTWMDQTFQEARVSAVLRRHGESEPQEAESLVAGTIRVGGVQKNLTETALTITVSLKRFRQAAAKRLLRDAREQVPADSLAAIFLDLWGSEAARSKLLRLISQPSYSNTPWVSGWRGDQFSWAVWRRGQVMEERLLAPKG